MGKTAALKPIAQQAMPETPPAVSVIIPAFNAQDTIAATLRSVLSQTWTRFEAIVIDDESADCTVEIVEEFARKDKRVRLVSQIHGGTSEARNRGIRESAAEWVAPLDADDTWTPDYLQAAVEVARSASDNVGVVYSWSTRMDQQGRLLPGVSAALVGGDVRLLILCHNFLGNGSCTLIRKSAIEKVGAYDRRLSHTEDWDLYLRLAECFEFLPVKRFTVRYRQGQQNASANHESMAACQEQVLLQARERNPDVPNWACQFSRSNLYIYLALQNHHQGDRAAMNSWLRRAAEAYWFATVRPDWWWLKVFARGPKAEAQPRTAPSKIGRSMAVLRQLIGCSLLNLSLRCTGGSDLRKTRTPPLTRDHL